MNQESTQPTSQLHARDHKEAEQGTTSDYTDKKGNRKSKTDHEKLTTIKFVAIEFDYDKYKNGENQINEALRHGYVVIDNFKTESGLVMVMGLYRSRTA